MDASKVLRQNIRTFELWFHRVVWHQLERLRDTFHVVPVFAALSILLLLALDGQSREIYVSYLEQIGSPSWRAFAAIGCGAVGLALLSALLFEAQYWLSRPASARPYSDRSHPDAGSAASRLRRTAAILLALAPWFGVAIGLLQVQFYLGSLASTETTFSSATMGGGKPPDPGTYLPAANSFWIAVSALALGFANATFVRLQRESGFLRTAVVVTTPLVSILIFLLLTEYDTTISSAMKYVFLIYFPNYGDVLLVAGWAVGVSALTAGYLEIYRRLEKSIVYFDPKRWQARCNWRRHQGKLLSGWLILPWAVIAVYFAIVWALQRWLPSHGLPAPSRWASIPIAMNVMMIAGVAVTQSFDVFRRRAMFRWFVVTMIATLAVASRLLPTFAATESVVTFYRWVGPLGTMTLGLLFLLSILVLLAWLSRKSGLPAISLVVVTLVVIVLLPVRVQVTIAVVLAGCVVVGVMAAIARLFPIVGIAGVLAACAVVVLIEANAIERVQLHVHLPVLSSNDAPVESSPCQQFEQWLKQKTWPSQPINAPPVECRPSATQPNAQESTSNNPVHPAFIIAVEGGGIYAATAASVFLATLQHEAPNFSDHVFAISGVSGGAIGGTVFAALARQSADEDAAQQSANAVGGAPAADRTSGCLSQSPAVSQRRDVRDEVRAIMEDDHFSPVVGSIFPELLGSPLGRAEALAASFVDSVGAEDAVAGATICAPFADYWSPSEHVPALIMNATWAETGSRAAFAPFPLNTIDQSAYSFADKDMPPLKGALHLPASAAGAVAPQTFDVSLINAAVVSARFPGILPPFSLLVDPTPEPYPDLRISNVAAAKPADKLRWNFVDGGYADSSGTATALSLYRVLQTIAANYNVDLQIIVITTMEPQPVPDQIDGTAFRDTLAPIDAVLKVRENEGSASLARACDSFYPTISGSGTPQAITPCQDHAGQQGSHLQIVQVESEAYGLSLGWKLSQTTFDLIEWMLGSVQTDPSGPCHDYLDLTQTRRQRSYERNSCVLSTIVQALHAEQTSQH